MKRAALLADLAANFLLPWLAYRWAAPRWGEAGGLMASAVPPLVWSLGELIRHRRVDALSLLVLGGILLSGIALLLGGDTRMLLLRESLVSGLVGLAFLLSTPFGQPLLYHLALATVRRQSPDGGQRFMALWQAHPLFRTRIGRMNLVWGLGLVAETMVRAMLAWRWPPERFLLVSPWISYGFYGSLAGWTVWYRGWLKGALPPSAHQA